MRITKMNDLRLAVSVALAVSASTVQAEEAPIFDLPKLDGIVLPTTMALDGSPGHPLQYCYMCPYHEPPQ